MNIGPAELVILVIVALGLGVTTLVVVIIAVAVVRQRGARLDRNPRDAGQDRPAEPDQ